MDDEITITLSPTQLAAVLAGQPISPAETMKNRLFGGLRVLGGSLEWVGAAALLVTPEPTMATKVGGAALAVHGSDTISTGLWQTWTGLEQRSLTEQSATELALRLGAEPATAGKIGVGVDIAVPVIASLGAGAVRVAAIRGGRINLVEHEAEAGSKIGGHTILKHVGKTEAQLRQRLAAELKPPAISTFRSLEVAEESLYKALQANRGAIEGWAKTAGPGATKAFTFTGKEVVGQGVTRVTGKLTQMTNVKFVLKMEQFKGKLYYILTAHPE